MKVEDEIVFPAMRAVSSPEGRVIETLTRRMEDEHKLLQASSQAVDVIRAFGMERYLRITGFSQKFVSLLERPSRNLERYSLRVATFGKNVR